ncbi:uncharacterized protein F4807DRAFT_310353 [Annulohypoxylon truncatum]|uniref:uncharacterized protein n=1 Tax=Annulohypoxylon truncatum TaxID=327061 RepID=UPI0020078DB1|nr:uncharacterized protein F4807DRAFT_310353 [Annulohypoxylon truncatum]KAI1213072.1 hypothetical protein F4807DRAFT_310353 [Annulohypoxylon truncatum]
MDGETGERKSRKKRARLSCMECRKKKLSCDRKLPCQRCIRSGRPARCSFEAVAEQSPVSSPLARQQEQQIHDLQVEVTELKALLSEAGLIRGGDSATEASHVIDVESGPSSLNNGKPQAVEDLIDESHDTEKSGVVEDIQQQYLSTSQSDRIGQGANHVNDTQPSDPRKRTPQGYYRRHALFQFFSEIHELYPFIKETAEEWLNPLGVNITNGKLKPTVNFLSESDKSLERFLPPKEDVDILVSLYLNGPEQLHRVLHIPTFKREYTNFWTTQRVDHPTMIALILAIISISSTYAATSQSAEVASVAIKYQVMSMQWISLCEEWLRQQSTKHRRLAHYQIACLIYLAKRMNIVDKKKWWKETGSLIQDVIVPGLNRDSFSANGTPYVRELKRRIWAVIRELDLQNSYEYGLPSLLHSVDDDVTPPANVNDDDFNETSKDIQSKPLNEYTITSYQVHSARSWSLRLEISQRLFSTRFSKSLFYDDVLRYTHEVTQAIESIPSWDKYDTTGVGDLRTRALTRAFLLFQLKSTILVLHRPYLQKDDRRYWLSETVCYHTSRDILLLNTHLAELGSQSPTMLREDLLLASLNLVRVAMLRPKGLVTSVVTDYQSTIDLLEKCVPLVEDMHLRCCHSDLWCFITMYAANMLLEIHLGRKSRQTAKASCARRFLSLHHKQVERQKMCLPSHQCPAPSDLTNCADEPTSPQLVAPDFLVSDWLDSNYSEPGFDFLDFDVSMSNAWGILE